MPVNLNDVLTVLGVAVWAVAFVFTLFAVAELLGD
jgi:hypothetical protein